MRLIGIKSAFTPGIIGIDQEVPIVIDPVVADKTGACKQLLVPPSAVRVFIVYPAVSV